MNTRFKSSVMMGLAALAVFGITLAVPVGASAQVVNVKMATLVPEGSSWHQVLKEVAARWQQISGGKVRVTLFAGGVAGDEPDVVRKMRMGTLQAGVLSAVGVASIDKSVYALGIPMMYSSYEEFYDVLEKMRPHLEGELAKKGFVVLNWADLGWVRFFTKNPVSTPDQLKQQKLFQWAGDNDSLEILKSAGFNPVPLPATELATGLQTGLVNAAGMSPQYAVISQYYNYAKNMTDLNWNVLYGATVIKKDVWDRIPAELHAPLMQAAQDAGAKLRADIRRSGQADIEAMKKRGLNVVPVDAKTREQWVKAAEQAYPRVRGQVVPAEAFDEAMKYRDDYRKRNPRK